MSLVNFTDKMLEGCTLLPGIFTVLSLQIQGHFLNVHSRVTIQGNVLCMYKVTYYIYTHTHKLCICILNKTVREFILTHVQPTLCFTCNGEHTISDM